MAQACAEFSTGQRVVADSGGQAAWALPILRGQRQHAEPAPLLPRSGASDPEVVKPPQPTWLVQLEELLRVSEALPATEAPYRSRPVHPVAREVSFTEEPDVGNLQVRFCEGH